MRTAIAFLFLLCSVASAAEPAPLLKPTGKAFRHTSLLSKYAKSHGDFMAYELHEVQRSDSEDEMPTIEVKFEEAAQIVGLSCDDKSKGRNANRAINGATVTDVSKPNELTVTIDTTITTWTKIGAKDQSKYKKQMRQGASNEEKIAGIVGDVDTGNGISLLQSSALRQQAAMADIRFDAVDKQETREYVLRGFDSSRLRTGDKITFTGIFRIYLEDGKNVIEPYREGVAGDTENTVNELPLRMKKEPAKS